MISAEAEATCRIAPEIRHVGGCEAQAISHYLAPFTDSLKINSNVFANGLAYLQHAAAFTISAYERMNDAFKAEAEHLCMPYSEIAFDFFADAPKGTVFLFHGAYDESAGHHHYRHKVHGWRLKITPRELPNIDIVNAEYVDIEKQILDKAWSDDINNMVFSVVRHIREHYESVQRGDSASLLADMRTLIERTPTGSKFIMILNDQRLPSKEGGMRDRQWVIEYNNLMAEIASKYPFVSTISFKDCLSEDSENLGWGHYKRMVYYRMAESIMATVRELPGREA